MYYQQCANITIFLSGCYLIISLLMHRHVNIKDFLSLLFTFQMYSYNELYNEFMKLCSNPKFWHKIVSFLYNDYDGEDNDN
jgi:hypothetical protein